MFRRLGQRPADEFHYAVEALGLFLASNAGCTPDGTDRVPRSRTIEMAPSMAAVALGTTQSGSRIFSKNDASG
jgi:hypothetical protein